MKLRNQWVSIEDWAIANGIPEYNWKTALDDGISQNDNDVINIPESYPYDAVVSAEEYYDVVDVELYLTGKENDIFEVTNYLINSDSDIRQIWKGETFYMEYDNEVTKFMFGRQAYFCYLTFIQDRQCEFGLELSNKFPDVNITLVSTDINRNYWREDVIHNNAFSSTIISSFEKEAPDIYNEYLEEKANS